MPKPISEMPLGDRQKIRGILTDIDDTLTTEGKLLPCAYQSLAQAKESGRAVVVVTGRPAGWVDHIARMWPIDGVIGENGAFYFHMKDGKLRKRFLQNESIRKENRKRLERVAREILKKVPGSALASDQGYRECDLAIDYCEDVKPLDRQAVQSITKIFQKHRATCKVSSIHVNGWFGRYDKLKMTERFLKEVLGVHLNQAQNTFAYFGDSPNDEPLFAFFTHGIGVANIRPFLGDLQHPPQWITTEDGSKGFSEGIQTLLGNP